MNSINDVIKQHEDEIIKKEKSLSGIYSPSRIPIWCIAASILVIISSLPSGIELSWSVALLSGVFGIPIGLFTWWLFRDICRSSVNYNKRQLLVIGSRAIADDLKEDFFTKLVTINFKYIDRYYDRTESQAKSAFFITVLVAVVSFLLIVSGVVMSYLGKVEPSYIATFSGILGEFIASVFFYLYNGTVKKMSEYHSKLVLTQNIGIALKVSESLPDKERVTVQAGLVEQLTSNVNEHLIGVNTA
ncbi:TRADD-N-associated membrane domain-containing protein [Vibrio rotiferianus]|uniref:Cyanobacterial TRADD-N associated 2 transmembrane domain-containing protein n=1 Tax=Vibrio sp. DAT722 TaxID=344879 RepID=Q2F9S8_9VIBR|nr:ABC transporter ATP-binding protein [Vibrio rotiferianus]ABA55943.1 hypothetical protein [Vibrio sp. DAT722]